MITINLSSTELSHFSARMQEECTMYKPLTPNGIMVHGLLLEFFKKLHNRTAFPRPFNKFTFTSPQAVAFWIYFKNHQHRGELSDNIITQIRNQIDQKVKI